MKKFLFVLVLIGVQCFFVACTKQDAKSTHKHVEGESDQKTLWTCPMHPQIIKDHPGSCPICGMNLVPKEKKIKDEMGSLNPMPVGHAPFKLTLQRQQMIGVKTQIVEKKNIFKDIEVAGTAAFDPELYTAQSEYIEALKLAKKLQASSLPEVRDSAERGVASAKLRLKVLGVSDSYIDEITRTQASGSHLLSPKVGESSYVYAEIFEMDLSYVTPGLSADMSGGALGVDKISGKVMAVDQIVNPMTRTARARILITQSHPGLRPESFVNVKIRVPLGEHVAVPFDAVLDTGNQSWVFVAKDEGLFEPRIVSILYRAGNDVAIQSGVLAGEKIVTSANFLIDSESRLKGVLAPQSVGHDHGQSGQAPQKSPECPKGQVWHEQMKHCMPNVGG
ncbi:MAG: efflux RND transporter periplasmic adaptor subunit [Deltaproteobacteria bacterium]|nr:efflux RND transporter periplasmic adaptor subunit [Deltaproteobacteria bacterium]